MSNYNDLENSVEGGYIYENYIFSTENNEWKFTTNDVDQTEYTKLEIQRKKIQRIDNLLKQDLEITIPVDCAFAVEVFSSMPEEILGVQLFYGHYPASPVLAFKGRLVSVDSKKHGLVLKFEPISTTLKRKGFQTMYQRVCRHPLYGTFCGVNPSNGVLEPPTDGAIVNSGGADVTGVYKTEGAVVTIFGDSLVLDEVAEFPNSYFTAGYILGPRGLKRMIINHTGNTLQLIRGIPSLVEGETITVFAGCDHTFQTCKSKFANHDNYGGFDKIPNANPFNGIQLF